MTDEIKIILDSYNANTLTGMAQAAGFDVFRNGKKLKKKDLIDKLQAEFFSRERVLASLERLDRRERAVLNRLLLHEGKISTQRFRREIIRQMHYSLIICPRITHRGTEEDIFQRKRSYNSVMRFHCGCGDEVHIRIEEV